MENVRTEVEIDADICEFVPRFCESRRKDLQNLATYLAAEDFPAIAKVGHVIKGVSRPYGFPTLEKLAIEMEKGALIKDKAICLAAYDKMNDYLKKYLNY